MKEWKKIDANSNYSVSDEGDIRNDITKQYLKPFYNKKTGYNYIILRIGGKRNHFSIHRLVAMAFLDNDLDKEQVNHINGIKTDNRKTNLEWVTQSENILHSYRTLGRTFGMKGKRHSEKTKELMRQNRKRVCSPEWYARKAKKCYKKVLCVETNVIYPSIKQAAKETYTNASLIVQVCKGNPKNKTAGGYHWKYV